jgi:hypothetical protein
MLLGAVAVVSVMAPPAPMAAENAVPTIDLQARCKRSEAAQMDMMGDKNLQNVAFDSCMRSETDAKNAMAKAWSEIPATYKSFCVRPSDFSPSYIEWIACLELMIDLRKLRAATNSRPTDSDDRCPAIRYANDGSIISIWACPTGSGPAPLRRMPRLRS